MHRRDSQRLNHEPGDTATLVRAAAEAGLRGEALRIAHLEEPLADLLAPDHPTLRALSCALMCAGAGAAAAGWRQQEGGAQLTLRIGLESVRVRYCDADPATAWRDVVAISPLVLDLLAILVDRFVAEDVEVRLVRCGEMLAAKGRRRWGEERQALEAQMGRELMRLGRFSIGDDAEPLFAVTPVGDGRTSFVVALRPGLKAAWAAAPIRRLGRALAEFDHRANRGADVLAKKLGLYFSLAGAGSRPLVRTVGAVLKATGMMQELASGARGGRLADRFEEAILRLQERSLFLVSYRGGRELDACDERVKGWVKRWLETELVVRSLS
jgi:hypothetical protein